MNDTDFGAMVLSDELMKLHRAGNVEVIKALASAAVSELATADDIQADLPKTLMLLALLDHMGNRRTVGMISDYLNF